MQIYSKERGGRRRMENLEILWACDLDYNVKAFDESTRFKRC
jgi:hypothetical protein